MRSLQAIRWRAPPSRRSWFASCRHPGIDKRLGDAHAFCVLQGGLEAGERIGAPADVAPGDGRGISLEKGEGPEKVSRLAPPAAADLEVLAIDLAMRVDGAVAHVGVMAGDHVPA